MTINLDIGSQANIIRESHRTSLAQLEYDTAAMERKLSRYGWAKRYWDISFDVYMGIGLALSAVVIAIGGVL